MCEASAGAGNSILKNGLYYERLLLDYRQKLSNWSIEYDADRISGEETLSEEVEGMMRTAVGKAQLLILKRFPQFFDLCKLNMECCVNNIAPRDNDLEGYFDVMLFSIRDVERLFNELYILRLKSWIAMDPVTVVLPVKAASPAFARKSKVVLRAPTASFAIKEAMATSRAVMKAQQFATPAGPCLPVHSSLLRVPSPFAPATPIADTIATCTPACIAGTCTS